MCLHQASTVLPVIDCLAELNDMWASAQHRAAIHYGVARWDFTLGWQALQEQMVRLP